MSYAKSIFLANLTRDPELKFTPKGTAIANIGIAVNRKWKTETGEMKESVSFFDLKSFGKQAETIGQYLRKGSMALFDCRPEVESWDDKNTQQKRIKVVFVIESFSFCGGKQEGGAPASRPAPAPRADAPPSDPDMPPQDTEEPLPF
jgi:single-strand DNA-binding protein